MVTEVRHELPREASKLARGYVDGSQSAPVAFNSEREIPKANLRSLFTSDLLKRTASFYFLAVTINRTNMLFHLCTEERIIFFRLIKSCKFAVCKIRI